jgi:hypothetical protein
MRVSISRHMHGKTAEVLQIMYLAITLLITHLLPLSMLYRRQKWTGQRPNDWKKGTEMKL